MYTNEDISSIAQAARQLGCVVLENEPLSKYTSFRIGGNAAALIIVEKANELSELYSSCSKMGVPCFVIGNGSNLLIDDSGYKGIVFKLEGSFRKITITDENTVKCGAGTTLAKLCKFALEHHLSGLEFAWGIPGTVGGAAYMNAGAYGGEMKDVVESSAYISSDGTLGTMSADEMRLSYRHSIYSEKDSVITSVTFKLKPDDYESIRSRMDDFMTRRRTKQPLEFPSAGSVFKRPEGYFAGGLIEECSLKGYSIGDAQVSQKHAGFIINKGNATCKDVCDLIKHIQDTVLEQKGVKLECEVKHVKYTD